MEGYLVLVDIDKIQDFILSTPKLKTIVGASILVAKLTSFNYCKNNTMLGTLNEVSDFGELANNGDYLVIFFGGGNIKIIFKDSPNAKMFVQDLQRCFIKEAPSASFSNVIYKFNDVFTNEIIEKAEKELQKIKLSKRDLIYVNTNPIFKLCKICKKYPVCEIEKVKNEDEYLCSNCNSCLKTYKNYKEENNEILLKDFYDKFKDKYGVDFEEKFDDIKDKKGFLAVITMDGNDFGEKLKKITTDKKGDECIRFLRSFSESLKKSINSVLLDSLDGVLTNKDVNKNGKMPFRPVIIGGDDICLTIAADKVFKFIQKFNENVLDNHFFKENKITYSIGISITKSHFPFYFSYQISEQLVKNGKVERKSREINRDTNMLDWEIIHSSVFDDLSKIRKEIYDESYPEYPGENYRLTYKPYNFIDRDFKSFKNLKEINETLKKILGNSKFKNLRKLVRESKKLSNYEFRKIISKLDEDKKRKIVASLSKLKITTDNIWYSEGDYLYNNFLDLVELSDFISERGQND